MNKVANLADLLMLFKTRGHQQYGGEAVTQLEHALQCATLAETGNQSQEMIVACLLHDIGHLLDKSSDREKNDNHESRAIPLLQQFFSAAVTEPIRLHVRAKQYLCAVDAGYWETLSPQSRHTLQLQGGIFNKIEAEKFINQPFAQQAVQLRQWDDRAKVVGFSTPDLDHFVPIVTACVQQ